MIDALWVERLRYRACGQDRHRSIVRVLACLGLQVRPPRSRLHGAIEEGLIEEHQLVV